MIMDELGRGTSTFDGYAIAHSVLSFLTEQRKPQLLFTTHYTWLVDKFKHNPKIRNFHMAYLKTFDPEAKVTRVTFLYKFRRGASESSFGINVARIAGLPQKVIEKAEAKSRELLKQLESEQDSD